jgi:hypothetical protein
MVIRNVSDSSFALEDSSCGLDVRGYELVPNDVLFTTIGVYTPEIVEAILSDHSEIVDMWLSKLHEKYLTLKKSCEFDSNPVACFNVLRLEQFEKHFQFWKDGGIITISIKSDKVIRVRNEKRESGKHAALPTNESPNPCFTCGICSSTFSDSEEYGRHRLREIKDAKNKEKQSNKVGIDLVREKDTPRIPSGG